VAEDGDGENGIYTQALLESLDTPGLNEDQLFKKVGALVQQRTGGRQKPWRDGQLSRDFVFNVSVNVQLPARVR
jgi:uncharacterized caspase-like protein